MKKNLFKCVGMVLASVMLLTSCGGSTAPTASPAASDMQSSAASGAGGVTINYYSMWNETEAQAEVIKSAVVDYEKTSGNKVNITWVGRDIQNTIRAKLDGGEQVDLYDTDMSNQVAMNKNYMLDISDMYNKANPILDNKSLNDVINPALTDLDKQVSGDGKMFSVPYQPYAFVVMYNKKVFADAGITQEPKTWAEFMDVCQKLKDANVIPITVDDAYRDVFLGTLMAKYKGYEWIVSNINDPNMWKDPGVVSAAKNIEEMATKGYWDPNAGSNVYPNGQTELALGSVAMYLNGTWLPNELYPQTGDDFEWGAFNFPSVENGVADAANVNYGAQGFFIPKTSKNSEATFELISTILSPKYDEMLSANTRGIPLSNDIAWPKLLEGAKPAYGEIKSWMQFEGGLNANSDIEAKSAGEFAKLVSGTITADEFIANMSK